MGDGDAQLRDVGVLFVQDRRVLGELGREVALFLAAEPEDVGVVLGPPVVEVVRVLLRDERAELLDLDELRALGEGDAARPVLGRGRGRRNAVDRERVPARREPRDLEEARAAGKGDIERGERRSVGRGLEAGERGPLAERLAADVDADLPGERREAEAPFDGPGGGKIDRSL